MHQKEKNRPVILITGTSNSLGTSLCKTFHEAGYEIIWIDSYKTEGMPCKKINFDISRLADPDDECKTFFSHVEELTNGRLDSLVNNASTRIEKPVESITAADWKKALDTNLLAPFWLVMRFLPLLRAAKGSVVNVISIRAAQVKPALTAYSASEAALISLTRSLAVELGPEIRVNAVMPAANVTPLPSADEIAQAAFFLSGRDARAMTGAIVNVEKGMTSSLT